MNIVRCSALCEWNPHEVYLVFLFSLKFLTRGMKNWWAIKIQNQKLSSPFFNFVWLQARCQITSVSTFYFIANERLRFWGSFSIQIKILKKCPSVSVYYCLIFSICKRKEKKFCLFPCYCKAILIIISPVFCCCFVFVKFDREN